MQQHGSFHCNNSARPLQISVKLTVKKDGNLICRGAADHDYERASDRGFVGVVFIA